MESSGCGFDHCRVPRQKWAGARRNEIFDATFALAFRSDKSATRSQQPFRLSAKTTLALAQTLYEKHKALTYPRTDSRALPEDTRGMVKKTLQTLAQHNAYVPFANQILDQGWVKPNRRIFNNAKISDHFAIIPTAQAPKSL